MMTTLSPAPAMDALSPCSPCSPCSSCSSSSNMETAMPSNTALSHDFPDVLVFQTCTLSPPAKRTPSLFMTYNTCSGTHVFSASPDPLTITSATLDVQGAYMLLDILAQHLFQYFDRVQSNKEDESFSSAAANIHKLRQTIESRLLDPRVQPEDYWQLNAPIQEIDANVAHVFADPMYKNTQLFKYTTDERLFAKEFRRQPFYLHVPLVYKSVYNNLHQSCHVYLTFSEAPSASPAKTLVQIGDLLTALVEMELLENHWRNETVSGNTETKHEM